MATTKERIASLEEDLDAAYAARRQLIVTGRVQEYKLNDGQTINHMIYKTPEQLKNLIDQIQADINKLNHKLTGRQYRCRDKDSFNQNYS